MIRLEKIKTFCKIVWQIFIAYESITTVYIQFDENCCSRILLYFVTKIKKGGAVQSVTSFVELKNNQLSVSSLFYFWAGDCTV